MNKKFFLSKGFTLIELIVVMAVIAVLAGITIVAVNPFEQIAKARDTSRISAIAQLGQALESYQTNSSGTFPTPGNNWMDALVTGNDLRSVPDNPAYLSGSACANSTLAQGGYCYNTGSGDTIIYSRLESGSYNKNCSGGTPVAYWVYSVAKGKGSGVCVPSSQDPDVSTTTVFTF